MHISPLSQEANKEAKYHCPSCSSNVGTPPVLRETGEDYRDIAVSLDFSVGGWNSRRRILIKKDNDGIELSVWHRFSPFPPDVQRKMKKAEWEKLLDRLYGKLYLHEWDKEFINHGILDGTQWYLKIAFTGDRVERYGGSNCFPPYWNDLKELFKPYWQEAENASIGFPFPFTEE